MSKFCPTCKILKEDNMFYKCKSRKDGLRGQCKECESKAVKKYSETHPNKNREYVHIRNARKKNIAHTFTTNDWEECLKFFNNKDAYTGLSMKVVSQDHVIPLINGGEYSKQNIVPCDKVVNSSKNKNNMELWYSKQPYYSQERLNKIHKWIEINTI